MRVTRTILDGKSKFQVIIFEHLLLHLKCVKEVMFSSLVTKCHYVHYGLIGQTAKQTEQVCLHFKHKNANVGTT